MIYLSIHLFKDDLVALGWSYYELSFYIHSVYAL